MATNTTKYEIYLMNVPFNNTYSDVVLFNSHSAQANAFIGINKYHFENLNIIVKNNTFLLRGRWDKFNECNYMMWRYTDNYGTDNDHTSQWYFSFIDEVKYNTRLGTTIYHTLDVWQTYHIDVNFNRKTMIERGMVRPAEDTFGRWLAPEPLSSPASVEKEISIFSDVDFTPYLFVDSLSKPYVRKGQVYNGDTYFNGFTSSYSYGGNMTGVQRPDEKTGYYRFFIYHNAINTFFRMFTYPEKMVTEVQSDNLAIPVYNSQSHMTDIIQVLWLPKFILDNSNTQPMSFNDGVHTEEALGYLLEKNENIHIVDSADYNRSSGKLACGYKPHNVKMYTSLCRAFKIYNKNSLSIPIKTELLTSTQKIHIALDMSNFSDTMKITVNYYDNLNKYFDIPYSYQMGYGYNYNTGVAHASKVMQLLNQDYIVKHKGLMPYVTSTAEMAVGTASLLVGGVAATDQYQGDLITGVPSGMQNLTPSTYGMLGAGVGFLGKGMGDLGNAIFNGRELQFNYAQNVADTYASISASIGNSSNTITNMNSDFWKLRLADCSPLEDECRQIEDFLDRFGYTINELLPVNYFLKSRSYWNFIKTKDCQLKTNSPNHDNVLFNQILNNGVTVWKDLSYVGNFTYNNYKSPSNSVALS